MLFGMGMESSGRDLQGLHSIARFESNLDTMHLSDLKIQQMFVTISFEFHNVDKDRQTFSIFIMIIPKA